MKRNNKRGQLAIFIIIGVLIVAAAMLVIFIAPNFLKKQDTAYDVLDPEKYVADCMNPYLESFVETLSNQGGSLEMTNCIFYKDSCRNYLCYTSTSYVPCINQKPLLKKEIEEELEKELKNHEGQNIVQNCINKFAEAARRENWDATVCNSPIINVNLTQGKIKTNINCDITLSKGEKIRRIEELEPELIWPLYDFVLVIERIINDEITYTDFDPVSYMLIYPWIELEKFRSSEGSKVYTLKEKNSGREFIFAVRNYVFPPGII